MTKLRILVLAAAIAGATLPLAAPASATTCAGELGDVACYVIGVVDGSQEVCLPNGKCLN